MATEEGYTRYACDRSEEAHPDGKLPIEFLKDPDKRISEWHKVPHTDMNGVTSYYWLCEYCYEKYQSVQETWQRDFEDFYNEGR